MSPNSARERTPIDASRGQILLRGFTLRCPRCGSGGILKNWFKIKDECPKCQLVFEREPGYWTGALAINLICPLGLLMITLFASLIATSPNVPVVPLVIISITIALLGPLVWYPFSRTLWLAIDHGFLVAFDHDD
ncbi:MAG: DUF983 domain-containing protein [Acidimicrobiia bacterium]